MELKYWNKYLYHKRCIVCNKVSSEEIETNVGDTLSHVFFNDTISQGWICFECDNWTEILLLDYLNEDEDFIPLNDDEFLLIFDNDNDNEKET